MDGRAVKSFVHDRLPQFVREALVNQALVPNDIDVFVPHQANVRILEDVTKAVGLSQDQLAVTADRYGNTGAASIPITLDQVVATGRLKNGGRVLLAGFGGGMTWGTAVLEWPQSAPTMAS